MRFQKEVLNTNKENKIMKFDTSEFKYSFENFIGIYENAFTPEECAHSIKLFEKYRQVGYTYNRLTDNAKALPFKDDEGADVILGLTTELDWSIGFIQSFHDRFYNLIYPLYNMQYPILQTLVKHQSRYIKLQKTEPGQGYHVWHCEHDGNHADRLLSWILYLNDIEDGGETEFLYHSKRIKPKTGTLILFPGAFTHAHRGNPPLKETKYIATGWIEFMTTQESQGPSTVPDLSKPNFEKSKFLYSNEKH